MINLRSMLDTKCFGSSLVPGILLLIAPHSSQAQLSVDPEGKLYGMTELVDPSSPLVFKWSISSNNCVKNAKNGSHFDGL